MSKTDKTRTESNQLLKALAICLGPYFFGYATAFFSALNSQITQIHYTSALNDDRIGGPLNGMVPLGAIFGVGICHNVLPIISRRTFLLTLAVLNIFFTLFLQISSLQVLFIFRILQGFIVGNYMTLVPIYINQLYPNRYKFLPCLAVGFGSLTAYGVSVIYDVTNLDYEISWRLQMGFPIIPCTLQAILILIKFIPQSPANQPLTILAIQMADRETFVDNNLNSNMISSFLQTKKVQIVPEASKQILKGIIIIMGQGFCGFAAFVAECGKIFLKLDAEVGRYAPIVIIVFQIIGIFISIPLKRKFSLRRLIIVGGMILGSLNLAIAFSFLFYTKTLFNLLLSVFLMSLFMLFFGMTLYTTVDFFIGTFIINKKYVRALYSLGWFCAGFTMIALGFNNFYISPPYPVFFAFSASTFILTLIYWLTLD